MQKKNSSIFYLFIFFIFVSIIDILTEYHIISTQLSTILIFIIGIISILLMNLKSTE